MQGDAPENLKSKGISDMLALPRKGRFLPLLLGRSVKLGMENVSSNSPQICVEYSTLTVRCAVGKQPPPPEFLFLSMAESVRQENSRRLQYHDLIKEVFVCGKDQDRDYRNW